MKCEACGHENVDGARFCAKCGSILATPTEGPDPLIGQVIGGRYRVTGVLGEGGMGKVYVGEQQMGSTVRKVAIKTLHQHLSTDPSVLQRFHRECGTVAQLEHPNTIKFFDFGATHDGTLYIAMEFVAGKSLSDVIGQQGPLSPDRVNKIMRQVCGALDEAHLQGIIHRDLKPDNIVLTDRAGETDFVKVLDFGIAARRESGDAHKEQKLTQQGMVLGTPPYMSPEQFTGKALDARSDIYSLGVMVYEMLTSSLPFHADTPWQWATQHMTAQPTPFEVAAPSRDIPAGMKQAILKALSKDREQRQPSAREFFSDLSGGGRMTVTGDVPGTGPQHTDTAAMPMPPDFGQPAPNFPPGPMQSPALGATPYPHVPATAPAVVAHVPPPPVVQKSSGNKGLVIGLGAVGAALLAAMGVLAMRSGRSNAGDPQTLTIPTTTTPAASDTTAFGPLATSPTPSATAPSAASTPETPTTRPTSPSSPSTAHTSAAGTSTAKPVQPAGDACEACEKAAQGGDVRGAMQHFAKCSDESKKTQCLSRIKNNAPAAAQAAVSGGNCKLAKEIEQATGAINASSAKLRNIVKNCK
jgi:serine/threonine-protein kinase